jgi:hypothetical protein
MRSKFSKPLRRRSRSTLRQLVCKTPASSRCQYDDQDSGERTSVPPLRPGQPAGCSSWIPSHSDFFPLPSFMIFSLTCLTTNHLSPLSPSKLNSKFSVISNCLHALLMYHAAIISIVAMLSVEKSNRVRKLRQAGARSTATTTTITTTITTRQAPNN